MSYRPFEDLEMWALARKFAVDVYRALEGCRDFNFRNQITDAACSISNNIAEGAERLPSESAAQLRADARLIGGKLFALIRSLSGS